MPAPDKRAGQLAVAEQCISEEGEDALAASDEGLDQPGPQADRGVGAE